MKKMAILLALILCVPLLASTADLYKVSRVIDGDTFVLENGETVRLIGVDTPETVHPSKPVEYFGKEASAFTRQLLEGKTVRLEYDWQMRDKYDRILAYAFLGDLFVNAEIIKQGYGHAYTKYPFKQEYMDQFHQLEREAREAGRGLWAEGAGEPKSQSAAKPDSVQYWLNSKSNTLHNSSCRWYGNTAQGYYTQEPIGKDCGICGGAHQQPAIQPQEQQTDQDVIVYVTRTGSKYHRAGCRYLKKSAIPIKLSEARGRYSPCSVCNPPK